MPIKPRPFTYECEGCGWTRIVAPQSDALRPGEWFDQCPKCGSKALKMRSAGWFEGMLAKLFVHR